ncbi:MAG: glycosyltransferase family 39 protein, partial [Anaerolineae bacterium]|nr:glycosyltransferase family 39 protein [Anaerolineae bacterium]
YYPALAKADEAFVFSMGQNVLENGHVRPLIYRQAYPENYYGGIWTWMMGGWLRAAGLSLTSGRLYILFLSLIALLFTTFASARLYGKTTAVFTALVGAFTFISANHIRFDIHAALWLSMGIFFYSLTDKPRRWWAHLLTGFAIGMTVDSNPVAYCFALGLALVYGWEYVARIRRERRWFWPPFWWVALGGMSAAGVFLIVHAGGTFAAEQTTSDVVKVYIDNILQGLTSWRFLSLTGQYFSAFLTNQPILTGLMALGLLTAIRDFSQSDRFLVFMYAAWMGIIIFAYFYFPAFYIVLGIPLFAILAGRGLARGLPWLIGSLSEAPTTLSRAVVIFMAVWLLSGLTYNLKTLPSQSLEDVVETGRQIGAITPGETAIVGAEPYYFGMIDHPNFIGGAVESLMVNFHDMTPEEAWAAIAPDALIFSEGWPTEPQRNRALLQYMSEQDSGMRACFLTESFGRVELWMRDAGTGDDSEATCVQICNPRTGCSG